MDTKQSRRRAAPFKSWHPNWKQKLRDSCLERVKKDRDQLLWKMRLTLPEYVDHTGFGSDLGGIVRDEIDKLNKKGDGHTCDAKISHDTMLWEYEPSAAFSELDPEDYEELMISMQGILYDEMQQDSIQNKEASLLEEFERSCEQEDHVLSTMLEQLQSGEDGVFCPICKTRKLKQAQHLIYCGCGHLRLNVQHEKVDLEFLRGRLEELLQQHMDLGCKCQPVFCTDNRFSITALYLQCSSCETFELVI